MSKFRSLKSFLGFDKSAQDAGDGMAYSRNNMQKIFATLSARNILYHGPKNLAQSFKAAARIVFRMKPSAGRSTKSTIDPFVD